MSCDMFGRSVVNNMKIRRLFPSVPLGGVTV